MESYGGAKQQKLCIAIFCNKLEKIFTAAKYLIILLGTNLLEEETNTKIANIGTILPRVNTEQIQANAMIPIVNNLIKKLAVKTTSIFATWTKPLQKEVYPKLQTIGPIKACTQIGNLKCKHFLINYAQAHCK